jgi:hypothetical protein
VHSLSDRAGGKLHTQECPSAAERMFAQDSNQRAIYGSEMHPSRRRANKHVRVDVKGEQQRGWLLPASLALLSNE